MQQLSRNASAGIPLHNAAFDDGSDFQGIRGYEDTVHAFFARRIAEFHTCARIHFRVQHYSSVRNYGSRSIDAERFFSGVSDRVIYSKEEEINR